MSGRDQILAATDRRELVETVPEWEMDVLLQAADGTLRALFREVILAAGDTEMAIGTAILGHAPEILARSLADPTTKELYFDPDNAEDLALIAGKNGEVLERLTQLVINLSDMGESAKEDAKKD